jgi:hypothetical protein
MKIYTCWITCMLESYQDKIVAGLIKKGYTVGLASSGKAVVNHENQVSAIIGLTVYKLSKEELSITEVYEDFAFVMTDMKGYFYSIIVAETNNSTWAGSNIFLQPKKATQLLPPPSDHKKSKLN